MSGEELDAQHYRSTLEKRYESNKQLARKIAEALGGTGEERVLNADLNILAWEEHAMSCAIPPWYSVNSELPHFRSDEAEQRTAPALAAVYTAGYEGNSIDRFLDRLMKRGIYSIIDVRSNPISRKYGFSQPGP